MALQDSKLSEPGLPAQTRAAAAASRWVVPACAGLICSWIYCTGSGELSDYVQNGQRENYQKRSESEHGNFRSSCFHSGIVPPLRLIILHDKVRISL